MLLSYPVLLLSVISGQLLPPLVVITTSFVQSDAHLHVEAETCKDSIRYLNTFCQVDYQISCMFLSICSNVYTHAEVTLIFLGTNSVADYFNGRFSIDVLITKNINCTHEEPFNLNMQCMPTEVLPSRIVAYLLTCALLCNLIFANKSNLFLSCC